MGKCEVLSPAGDLVNFYTAIEAGADAVYLGLNKFNARMKADNISLDNLTEVVNYAHLKGVKVYVTLNTLISNSEMKEVVSLVGECLNTGVDAFIVQDFGIIGVLKNIYPNIVLHGSTQLGVHNVRGARVAKNIGLSRVVLSREVALEDIKEISKNVDIELECFVQGAMCVAFSGNCYLSSLKFGASGNRGECKQLCRLPYKMSCQKQSIGGYVLSPRDNCMLERLQDLIEAGVVSLKIEGRLRRKGYVNIATRIYGEAIDYLQGGRCCQQDLIQSGVDLKAKHKCVESFNENKMKSPDLKKMKNDLAKVFARGEFVQGYFNGNNIIDTTSNNHMGIKIGKVVACSKFKDIYKISIETNEKLNSGDGLKFVNGSNMTTLGVGNVEFNGKIAVVYGKNYVNINSDVYRVLDEKFENEIIDKSKYRDIKMSFNARVGSLPVLTIISEEYTILVSGEEVSAKATSKPTTVDSIIANLSKLGEMRKYFNIEEIVCNIDDNIFLPVSEINSLRREGLTRLCDKILMSYKCEVGHADKVSTDFNNYLTLIKDIVSLPTYSKLVMVDENCGINNLSKDYDGVILSPTIYDVKVIENFYNNFSKKFNSKLILNMPIIALRKDIFVLDKIVDFCKDKDIVLLANNIYTLDYINSGVEVWAGSNMNVCNDYSCLALLKYGVKEIVSSIEKWFSGLNNTYKMCGGKRVLMTFAHCPCKTLTSKGCANGECGYCGDIYVKGEGQEYSIRRYKVASCYFELVDSVKEKRTARNCIDDIRE